MRILIFQRVPFQFIRYDEILDHDQHEIVYVGEKASLDTVPAELRCTKVERPGVRPVADEVIDIFASAPRFDRLISMSQYEALEAARVREVFGIYGPKPADVRRADDKIEMKHAVRDHGLRAPRFLTCRQALDGHGETWKGKTVLKPVDGTASKDVHVFETYDAAKSAVATNSTGIRDFDVGRFELEEFVEGPVLYCDGLMLGGRPIVAIVSKYLGSCLGFALGEPLGVVQLPENAHLLETSIKYVKAVGIENGSFHLEMIQAEDGPVFLEVAARAGGAAVVEVFERTTGINLTKADLVIGLDASPLSENPYRDYFTPRVSESDVMTYGFFMFPGHKLNATHGRVVGSDAFRDHPAIVKWTQLDPQTPLPKGVTYFDFELPLTGMVAAKTSAEIEALITRILSEVRVVPA